MRLRSSVGEPADAHGVIDDDGGTAADVTAMTVCRRCRRTGSLLAGPLGVPTPALPARGWTCPWCQSVVSNRSRLQIVAVAGTLGVLGLALQDTGSVLGWPLVDVAARVIMVLAPLPLIVFHELAHAVVARMLGAVVSAVTIGSGRLIASKTVGLCRFELRRLPWGGSTTLHLGQAGHLKLRQITILFAGPVSDACFLLLFLRWDAHGPAARAFDV